jgi:hypothetical protein
VQVAAELGELLVEELDDMEAVEDGTGSNGRSEV